MSPAIAEATLWRAFLFSLRAFLFGFAVINVSFYVVKL